MSKLQATVSDICNVENLTLVTFDARGQTLAMVSLDLNEEIKIGSRCILGVNPSSVAICKAFSGMLSYSNQISAKITHIDNGQILCSLQLSIGDVSLVSLITAASAQRMDLKVDDVVTALIKANELFILEVL